MVIFHSYISLPEGIKIHVSGWFFETSSDFSVLSRLEVCLSPNQLILITISQSTRATQNYMIFPLQPPY